MKVKEIFVALSLIMGLAQEAVAQQTAVSAAMKNTRLVFSLDEKGVPRYAVSWGIKEVIRPSRLGFLINGAAPLDSNFELLGTDTLTADNTWTPVWGEVARIRDHHKQLTVHLKQKGERGILLNIVFRLFEEGLGFRYEFPLQRDLKFFVVAKERTEFNLAGDHKTFWIPGDYDSNEYPYTTSRLSEVDASGIPMISFGDRKKNIPDPCAVQTPLMMKTADGLYINIHEAALVDYSSMQLHVDRQTFGLSVSLVPDAVGNGAYLRTPAKTPWRTVIVSDKAADLLASKMILNLNEPSKLAATDWIKPMKYMGVWWEMQTGRSTWNYTDNIDSLTPAGALVPHGKHAATTANVKRYIDFAARHGISGLLVEGWNRGWEEWTGIYKEENFDYVTPYPDFDLPEIARYAKEKGVQMIMHNETGGSATNYDRRLDTAFRLMNHYGYPAVKTGYVGTIIPAGEHHDGQWMIGHYLRTIQKAAQHRVSINIHEPVRPTGLHRTWPNFLASEAGRGNEWNAFSEGSPPEHETILPFTRLMGGPMDYTPGIFRLRNYAPGAPGRQMHSTLAKQLALYVTMYSPLQMVADLPEHYEPHLDAFQFIKDVPVDWDDTKILEAEPGDYLTIARKEKGRDAWFIGAITDENSRSARLPLHFLERGKTYLATVYRDAETADWKHAPEAYTIERFLVDSETVMKLNLAKGGGAALSIVPATAEERKTARRYRKK